MKDNDNNLIKIIPYILGILGIITFMLIFLEAVYTMYEDVLGFSSGKIDSYTGINIAFGVTSILRYNILAFLAYLLSLIAGVLSIIKTKEYKTLKFFTIGVTFIVSSILLISIATYLIVPMPIGQTLKTSIYPIIGGVTALIAAILSFYYTLKIQK